MATTNQYMKSTANMMYELSADRMVKEQCRRRAEYERFQKYQAEEIARKDALIADQDTAIATLKTTVADQKAVIEDKDALIADKNARIAYLEQMLANVHKKD